MDDGGAVAVDDLATEVRKAEWSKPSPIVRFAVHEPGAEVALGADSPDTPGNITRQFGIGHRRAPGQPQ